MDGMRAISEAPGGFAAAGAEAGGRAGRPVPPATGAPGWRRRPPATFADSPPRRRALGGPRLAGGRIARSDGSETGAGGGTERKPAGGQGATLDFGGAPDGAFVRAVGAGPGTSHGGLRDERGRPKPGAARAVDEIVEAVALAAPSGLGICRGVFDAARWPDLIGSPMTPVTASFRLRYERLEVTGPAGRPVVARLSDAMGKASGWTFLAARFDVRAGPFRYRWATVHDPAHQVLRSRMFPDRNSLWSGRTSAIAADTFEFRRPQYEADALPPPFAAMFASRPLHAACLHDGDRTGRRGACTADVFLWRDRGPTRTFVLSEGSPDRRDDPP